MFGVFSQIQGWAKIKGDTDGTKIGNVDDQLKTQVNFNPTSIDPFGRLKVANNTSLWQYTHRYGDDVSRYWDNNGVGTFSVNTSKVAMVITGTTTNGNTSIYRTKRYFEYHKGRAQTLLMTLNPNGQTANVTKRWGMFDDANGVRFTLDGTNGFGVEVLSSTSGSAVADPVLRANFNVDKGDGTGPSGITLDFTKLNLFYITYSWLGTNRVEFGFVAGGQLYPLHRYNYSNSIATSYSQSGNLPVCCCIENNAALGAAPTMEVNCLDVSYEGQKDVYGQVFDVSTGTTELTINTTPSVIAAVRMQSTKNRASLKPLEFDLISTSGNSTIKFDVHIGLVVGGSPTYNAVSGSIAEGLSGTSTAFTAGNIIQSGYVRASSDTSIIKISSDLYAGRLINGTSQTIALVAQTISSNSKLLFSGRYQEFK